MKITKFRILSIIFIIILGFMISYFYIVSHNAFGKIYKEETRNTIIEIKKTFLKDTINNIFTEIDIDRESEQRRHKNYVAQREISLSYISEDDDKFLAFFKNRFDTDIKNLGGDNYWNVVAWDNRTNKILYDPLHQVDTDIATYLNKIRPELLSYREINHGRISTIFGIKTKYLDDKIKLIVSEKIRRQKFSNDSYIWVNEVIDYKGGDNYAIRRVHPNLPESEGSYLSTSSTDVKGNKPYQEELDGINKDGELFFKYYFKKLNSDEVAEKLTYAKLYKDFDWIIATGVNIDEIDKYAQNTDIQTKSESRKMIFELMTLILALMAAGIALVVHTEGIYTKRINRSLKNEADIDVLTNAYSRRRGTTELLKAHRSYIKGHEDPAIMMFDLDKFKLINDNFGHDVGDIVLKKTVEAINVIVRDADIIIRWGGDEFIGIFYGLKKENVLKISQKILDAVNSVEIPVEVNSLDTIVKIEMSIGITYFSREDKQITDMIKRADDAMYKSKEIGRNRVTLIDLETEPD